MFEGHLLRLARARRSLTIGSARRASTKVTSSVHRLPGCPATSVCGIAHGRLRRAFGRLRGDDFLAGIFAGSLYLVDLANALAVLTYAGTYDAPLLFSLDALPLMLAASAGAHLGDGGILHLRLGPPYYGGVGDYTYGYSGYTAR